MSAVALAAPAAAAARPALTTIDEPLAPQLAPRPPANLEALVDLVPLEATAIGNGRMAWVEVLGVVPEQASSPVARVRTLRDGAPVDVAALPVSRNGLVDVELGTSTDGVAVLAVRSLSPGADPRTVLRLVNLESGAVRRISSTRSGHAVGGLAIDAGHLYYVLGSRRGGPRNTSSLWRATLTGTSIGHATKIRTSRRGESWGGLQADRGRVAVDTGRDIDLGEDSGVYAAFDVAFGTPRGPWSRGGRSYASDGGYTPVSVLGFTRRGSLLTAQGDGHGAIVTRTPAGGEPTARGRLGRARRRLSAPSYDPTTNRILAFGPDRAGIASVGWTSSVLW